MPRDTSHSITLRLRVIWANAGDAARIGKHLRTFLTVPEAVISVSGPTRHRARPIAPNFVSVKNDEQFLGGLERTEGRIGRRVLRTFSRYRLGELLPDNPQIVKAIRIRRVYGVSRGIPIQVEPPRQSNRVFLRTVTQ